MMRSAVLAPIPLILLSIDTFPVIMAFCSSFAIIDESIILAVLAPTPETEISNKNRLRSSFVIKPKSMCASSLMAS